MSTIEIRRVDRRNQVEVIATLAAAFQADPVSRWVWPDPDDRANHHPGFFNIFADLAMAGGQVTATDRFEAVALWMDVDPVQRHGSPGLAERFEAACGAAYGRFTVLDAQMTAAHPVQVRHAYLAFVGVHPEHQRKGLGTALIRHQLDQLDAAGLPSYLDASSEASLDLYERLGYRPLPTRIALPDGPMMWPMWRGVGSD